MRIAYYATVRYYGNSHVVVIPKHVRQIIEAEKGDYVRIEIETVIKNGNLHVDDAARQGPEARDKGIHKEE